MHQRSPAGLSAALLGAWFAAAALAQDTPPAIEDGDAAPAKAEHAPKADPNIATAPVKETSAVTHHTITVDGKPIEHEATAARLAASRRLGKARGEHVLRGLRRRQGAGDHSRPVTFFYNGGPGSSTVWLHLGSFGPVRIFTDAPSRDPGPPFSLEANEDTLLGKSDLVFLDAITTGYSRSLGDTKDDKFWGVDQDIDTFARDHTLRDVE